MNERIVIRCDRELRRRFRVFVVETGFDSAANALEYLLDVAGAREVQPKK